MKLQQHSYQKQLGKNPFQKVECQFDTNQMNP